MNLKELRNSYGITQKEAALVANVPLRTYSRYESQGDINNLKYQRIVDLLKQKYEINEEIDGRIRGCINGYDYD